jgi:Ca2+-binding EF-hand superfamily protein
LFKTFDIDNRGQISRDNLKVAFSKFGKNVSEEEIDEIMKIHDSDGGGTVDLEEF